MIRVQELTATEHDNVYTISAFADTKEEVTAGATFVGLPSGARIEMGSSVMTANGEIAFMKSTGEWNWLGEEE